MNCATGISTEGEIDVTVKFFEQMIDMHHLREFFQNNKLQ